MATFPNECRQMPMFGLALSTAKQASSPTTTIVHDTHPPMPCHHCHPWQPPPTTLIDHQQPPPPTTLVERQQRLWHARHITNQMMHPQHQQRLPPPPYWLPTTTADLAPNAAVPHHQPTKAPHGVPTITTVDKRPPAPHLHLQAPTTTIHKQLRPTVHDDKHPLVPTHLTRPTNRHNHEDTEQQCHGMRQHDPPPSPTNREHDHTTRHNERHPWL